MAIVKGPFQVSGSISNVSFYTRRGSDKVIMRTKGGAKKEHIKNKPQFEGFRAQQKEWSGVTKSSAALRMAFGGLHKLADYNLSAVLNSMCNKVQKADAESPKGSRPVCISKYKDAFVGFNFNRQYLFNSVLRVSLETHIVRENLKATVILPRINTDIDVLNVQRLPYFQLIVSLGTVSDMAYNPSLTDYGPLVPFLHGAAAISSSPWFASNSIVGAQTLEVQLTEKQQAALTSDVSVVLSMGIAFGAIGFDGQPTEVKYAGCGKVLGVV